MCACNRPAKNIFVTKSRLVITRRYSTAKRSQYQSIPIYGVFLIGICRLITVLTPRTFNCFVNHQNIQLSTPKPFCNNNSDARDGTIHYAEIYSYDATHMQIFKKHLIDLLTI